MQSHPNNGTWTKQGNNEKLLNFMIAHGCLEQSLKQNKNDPKNGWCSLIEGSKTSKKQYIIRLG